MADTLLVLTRDPFEAIAAAHGSAAWKLNVARASQMRFLVCVQNGGAEHGTAFLVAPISEIRDRPLEDAPDETERRVIGILRARRIKIPNAWRGGLPPVRYVDLANIGQCLDHGFEDLPGQTMRYSYDRPIR